MSQIFIRRSGLEELQRQTAVLVLNFVSNFPQVDPKTGKLNYIFSEEIAAILDSLGSKNKEKFSKLEKIHKLASLKIKALKAKLFEHSLFVKYSPKLEIERMDYGIDAESLRNTAVLVSNVYSVYEGRDVYELFNPKFSIKIYATEGLFLIKSSKKINEIFYPLEDIERESKDSIAHMRKDLKAIKLDVKLEENYNKIKKVKLPGSGLEVYIDSQATL
jgi:hypothetical protein